MSAGDCVCLFAQRNSWRRQVRDRDLQIHAAGRVNGVVDMPGSRIDIHLPGGVVLVRAVSLHTPEGAALHDNEDWTRVAVPADEATGGDRKNLVDDAKVALRMELDKARDVAVELAVDGSANLRPSGDARSRTS